jgi:RNA polymerase sigma-70 factor (ECF subfamily)
MRARTDVEAAGVSEAAVSPAELLTEAEFEQLYQRHGRALWAYLQRLTGSAADADDLLQEAFCRLLTTPLATRDDGELRAYLFRVASHAAVDLWRRRKVRGERGGAAGTEARGGDADRPAGGDPESELARRHDMGRTWRRLRPVDRMLLWLAYVEGLAHRDIARAAGVRPSSVPVMLLRARRKLAALLQAGGLGPGDR